ncbi:rho GDP-dissociation inhibitor 1-like [Panonychus citri]|uniref:rho GDP-dissociation inhibitor 1-like n=1 Tax=Panonychus citri TaxID=50023 RepID=UPI0023077721|nr:rho GDP-dissociation inhibitor 1-like [Panonychus citri]
MSEHKPTGEGDFEEGENIDYKAPPEKSLTEILETDKNDESLTRYKEALLGDAAVSAPVVDPSNPNRVIVKGLALLTEGRPDLYLDLTGNLAELKKRVYKIKEGIQYKIRIDFIVQREIVTGLKYVQKINRLGVLVEKISQMVGSYAPKTEIQSYTTPPEEMPSGLICRGKYDVKSLFTDDDKHEHLKWEWTFELVKEWE